MIPILTISLIALLYALIRAKHDSFINDGPWKRYAFIEGVAACLMITMAIVVLFHLRWFTGLTFAPLFGFVFWLSFDMISGWLRHRDVTYLGIGGWDRKMREVFRYPDWRWVHIIFRVVWIVVLTGATTELMMI